ncbi:MAG: ECF-type sigma factor [Pirellulales bacterium]
MDRSAVHLTPFPNNILKERRPPPMPGRRSLAPRPHVTDGKLGGWTAAEKVRIMTDVTQILSQIEQGDARAASQLLPLVYGELRKLAAAKLAQEQPGQTLQPTALVHEAYLRLVDVEVAQHWNSRGHFFGAAAEAMRRILIEQARRKLGPKAGGGWTRLPLEEGDLPSLSHPDRLLAVHDALDRLAAEDDLLAQLVKLRVFAGLNLDEAAQALGLSRTTVFRHWTYARAWLRAELAEPQ